MRNYSFLDLSHEIHFSNCMHFWCTHRYQETPNPLPSDIAFGKHGLLEFRIRDNQQIAPAHASKRFSGTTRVRHMLLGTTQSSAAHAKANTIAMQSAKCSTLGL